jgi:hypothetical protein
VAKSESGGSAILVLAIRYKGEERTNKLAFTQLEIRQLALEAGLREMKIGELISELVTRVILKNLFPRVLGGGI